MEFTAKQIAAYIDGEIVGDENVKIHTFAKIEEGVTGALSFLANPKYTNYIYETASSVVLVNNDFVAEKSIKATLIKTANAYESLAKLMTLYQSLNPRKTGIDPLASIASTARIGEEVYIGPFAVVGENAVIGKGTSLYPHVCIGDNASVGEDTVLYPHVAIYHDCKVGNRCILHAGCIIGADGFGFAPGADGYEKIPQIGIALIEDDVEIGANTCVDRATMGATVVKQGVKLDNLIQVAHNVVVGENTVMAAQSGIAGSTKVGNWCMVGGQVGISGHLHIGNQVQIGGHSGVTKNVKDEQVIMGFPAFAHNQFARATVVFRNLPEMRNDIDEMKKEIESLKKQLNQAD